MLDSDTKRRINTCRDILVGKVPDPKSQVEQITIALIYKFMDDMDLEAEELGGARSFFTGDFERYRFSKLVAPGVGGQEMLNLYTEALTKMVENPDLPELFRSIFRNAYLPYRDPETLRSFLREINSFTYDHSERLGDAFEYLLSVLGSQGDAGQFRTPRHIIDFMVEIIDPQKNEVILDPACGTAGFLISAYKHILKQNTTGAENGNVNGVEGDAAEQALESPQRYKGDLLSPDERARLARNIKGYDISPDMVRLSRVNMFLHAFKEPLVEEYDTLTSDDKWGETADVILANPPFMSPKGGIIPHNKFQVASKRSEVLFVDYIAEHLTPNGRAAIVVPEGIIFQSQSAYVALRKMLVESYLAAVISLPAGVFNPYSGVKTSILILDRAVAKASPHVTFFKIENDGFALGAQRRAVKGSQLAQVKAELGAWLQAARAGGGEGLQCSLGVAVERTLLAEGGDFNLSAERYAATHKRSVAWGYRAIGEICTKVADSVLPETLKGPIEYIGLENIASQLGKVIGQTSCAEPAEIKSLKTVFVSGDILYGKLRPNLNKVWQADRDGICSTDIFALRADQEEVDPAFLAAVLRSGTFNEIVMERLRGAQLPRIGWGDFSAIEIPLPPIEVQREIVGEIEGYQRVIDGASIVVENYSLAFSIEPNWPVLDLTAVSSFQEGPGILAKDFREHGVPLIRLAGVQSDEVTLDGCNYLDPDLVNSKWPHFRINKGDILISTSASFGRVSVATDLAVGAVCYTGIIRFWPNSENLHPGYLRAFLGSENFFAQAARFTSGAVIKHFGPTHLKQMKIPLPPMEVQEQIASDIEREQAAVRGNSDLMVLLGKKVDATTARLWGVVGDPETA